MKSRTGLCGFKESHVTLVRLLTVVITDVARDLQFRRTGFAGASTSELLGGGLSALRDVSGAMVGRSGEGLGGAGKKRRGGRF